LSATRSHLRYRPETPHDHGLGALSATRSQLRYRLI